MLRQEGGQLRNDGRTRERGRQIDAQTACQRFVARDEHRLPLFHVGEQILASLKARLAILRELHASCGPMQQARAQLGLQLLDGIGDAGARQAKTVGGLREAAGLRNTHEDAHGVELMHGKRRSIQSLIVMEI